MTTPMPRITSQWRSRQRRPANYGIIGKEFPSGGVPRTGKGPVSKTGGAKAPCGFESHPLRHSTRLPTVGSLMVFDH